MASMMSGDLQYGVATLSGETDITVSNLTATTITATDITTGSLITTTGIKANATQTINFGSNAPTMSGANIANTTIPDAALSGNVALKNASQTFTNQNEFSDILNITGTINAKTGMNQCGRDAQDIRIGDHALYNQNTPSRENIALGYNTLRNLSSTSANTNVAVGHASGQNITSGDANTFIGGRAGRYLTSGTNNLFFGADCGSGIISGNSNFAAGQAMVVSSAGGGYTYPQNNIGIGGNAFAYVGTVPSANIAIGAYSLYNDSGNGFGGTYTTAIGPNAGVRFGTNGSHSVFIGGCYNEPSNVNPINSSYTYVCCIGVDARADKSHCVVLGTEQEETIARGGLKVISTYANSYVGWCWNINLDGDIVFCENGNVNNYTIRITGAGAYNPGTKVGSIWAPSGQLIINEIDCDLFNLTTTNFSVPDGTILDNFLTSNVVLKNVTNVFTPGVSQDAIQVNTYGATAYLFMNADGIIGYYDWNTLLRSWQITPDGIPTFKTQIKIQNSNNNTLISPTLTSSFTGTNCTIMGTNAGNNLGSNDSIVAIGTNALYSLTNGNGFENMAIGNGAMYYLSKGNYNTAIGKQVGNALTYDCYENIMVGRNIALQQFTKPITYILYTGATLTSQSTLTMTAIPSGLYAGCRLLCYYSGNSHTAEVLSYNPTTFVITLGNTVSITTSTYMYFFEKELTTASYLNPTLRTSVLSFTIGTGLNIYAGEKMSYQTSATLVTTVGVASYNSGSGLLTLSSNVTVLASTTLYFMDTTYSWGANCNNNTFYGSQNMSRICTGASGNTCIGQNVMSANDATTSKNYVGGSNNTAVGINAGSLCYFKSNTNTFIGANADILSSSDNNNISHATAIGADAKVFQSNTVMLGSSSDIVHIPNQINIRTQFMPYAVSTITGTVSLTAPFYGTYIINTATTPITISLPASISGNMVGMQIWFKRITNANVVNVNLVSGSNIIYTRNSSTSTVGSALNSLLPATQYAALMICLSTTSWAIII